MQTPASYTLELSHDEMIALVKYHSAQIRAIPKKFGKGSMEIAAENQNLRDMKSLYDEAKSIMGYHDNRAKGILSLLKANKKG